MHSMRTTRSGRVSSTGEEHVMMGVHEMTTQLMRSLFVLVMTALVTSMAALAHEEHSAGANALGHVDFQVECIDEVRVDFDNSLGLLHHMMYVEARS